MPDYTDRPARKSPRLKDYDYAQYGAYFVTVCTQNRACLFGEVVDGMMLLNDCGQIVQTHFNDLPRHYANIELDAFVVMPNHVHGIIMILNDHSNTATSVGEGLKPSPTTKKHGLTEIVRGFKTFSARRINTMRDTPGQRVWQRSFHDHIIRDETDLNRLREYILTNPGRWEKDTLFNT